MSQRLLDTIQKIKSSDGSNMEYLCDMIFDEFNKEQELNRSELINKLMEENQILKDKCKECRYKKLYESMTMMCEDGKEIRIKQREKKDD